MFAGFDIRQFNMLLVLTSLLIQGAVSGTVKRDSAVAPDGQPSPLPSQPNSQGPVYHLERRFAQLLYQRLCLISGGGNLVVSPLVVDVLLAAVLEGAGGEGRSQLGHLLGLENVTISGSRLQDVRSSYRQLLSNQNSSIQMFNMLYLDKGFPINKDYLSIIREYYVVDVESVDMKNKANTVKIINSAVVAHTNNTIPDMIQEGDIADGAEMICVTTLHLRDAWALPFPRDKTSHHTPFFSAPDRQTNVDMMHMKNKLHYFWDGTFNAKILALDLTTRGVSLIVVLPDAVDGLANLEACLSNIDHVPLFRLVRSSPPVSVEVWLPVFRIMGSFDLENVLKQMGVANLFSPSGDLSGISCCGALHISKIRQKTFIVVNENGVEASSSAIVEFENGIQSEDSEEFRADHPFMFFLVKDEIVLFQGRFIQP